MVQEAPPLAAPPVDEASGPALSTYAKPAENTNGHGAPVHAAKDEDDDESDVDAWDILLEQAEESEHTPDGTPRPCSQRGSG